MVGAFVIGIHVLFAIGLIIGTAVKYVPALVDSIDSRLLKHEEEQEKKEIPPPPPDFKPPPVQTIVDLPTVAGPPPPAAIVAPKQEPKPEPAKPPPPPPPVTAARPAKGSNLGEACSAYYPSASKRLSEEGSVTLRVFVAPNGRVSETKVETTSGFPRLDEAAEKCMKANGRFEPQKVGNEAVGSWQVIKWTWRLTT